MSERSHELWMQEIREAREDAFEEAARLIDGCRLVDDESALGPMYAHGWNSAIARAVARLKAINHDE